MTAPSELTGLFGQLPLTWKSKSSIGTLSNGSLCQDVLQESQLTTGADLGFLMLMAKSSTNKMGLMSMMELTAGLELTDYVFQTSARELEKSGLSAANITLQGEDLLSLI